MFFQWLNNSFKIRITIPLVNIVAKYLEYEFPVVGEIQGGARGESDSSSRAPPCISRKHRRSCHNTDIQVLSNFYQNYCCPSIIVLHKLIKQTVMNDLAKMFYTNIKLSTYRLVCVQRIQFNILYARVKTYNFLI